MIDLPYEKQFTLTYKDGRRAPCTVRIEHPSKQDDGRYHAVLECRHVFPSGFERKGSTVEFCVAGLFQGLRDVLAGMEFSCEDENGQAFQFPSGYDIDKSYPTEEELSAHVARLEPDTKTPE